MKKLIALAVVVGTAVVGWAVWERRSAVEPERPAAEVVDDGGSTVTSPASRSLAPPPAAQVRNPARHIVRWSDAERRPGEDVYDWEGRKMVLEFWTQFVDNANPTSEEQEKVMTILADLQANATELVELGREMRRTRRSRREWASLGHAIPGMEVLHRETLMRVKDVLPQERFQKFQGRFLLSFADTFGQTAPLDLVEPSVP